jgi:hypothetical protein
LDYPASWKQESFPKFDQTSDLMQFAIPRFFAGTDGAFSADGKVAVFGNCPESEPLGLLPCKGEPGSVIKISGYPSKGAAEDQKTLLAKLEKVRSQSSATEASNGETTIGSYRGFQVLQNLVRFKHRVIILPQNGTGLLIQVINSGQTTDTEQIEAVLASLKIG